MNFNLQWTWFHRLGSPRWFYQKTQRWLPWLSLITLSLLIAGLVWGLAYAPPDAKQGNSFRIIYLHVPASVVALAGYYLMAIAGAVGLIWRIKLSYMLMRSAAPIGNWSYMGQANLGCLLGLGCAYHINADSIIPLPWSDGPAPYLLK
jgi:ABC-type transport system involved in cytochrome c biogenesis permease subunit